MAGRGTDLGKCEHALNKCERDLTLAIHLLKDIDMKLNHIIERMKSQYRQYKEMHDD